LVGKPRVKRESKAWEGQDLKGQKRGGGSKRNREGNTQKTPQGKRE